MRPGLVAAVVATLAALPTARAETPRPHETASVESAQVHDSETPSEKLQRARQAYARSDYGAVVRIVKPLLYPEVLLDSDDEIAGHKLLAMSYFFQGERNLAEDEFATLLQLRDDFALDPITDPPQAFNLLDSIRKRNREKLDELANEKRKEDERRRKEEEARKREEDDRIRRAALQLSVVRTVEKHYYVLNFVPFGMGQFQNGERRKGWAFFGTELGLAVASVALWATVYFGYAGGLTGNPLVSRADFPTAQALNIAAVAVGGAFFVEAAVGMIDAMVHYKPTVVTERKLADVPSAPVGKAPRVAPWVSASGGGLSLQGRF